MNYWRPRTLFALLAIVGLTFAIACGSGSDDDDDDTAQPTTATGEATVAPTDEAMEPASLKFQLDWIPNIQHFGPSYAAAEGLYAEENLEVTVQPGGQGVDALALVVGGGADIGVTSAPNIYAANENGADIVAFAAVFQKTPSAIVCRADAGISEFSDVSGKTFGSKGPSDETLPLIFAANGVTDVKIQPIGASSITEILAGIVDCQLAYAVNEPITLQLANVEPVIFSLADLGFGGQAEIYFTRREYFDEHQDVLVRFLKATAKAWEVYLEDPEAAAEWVVDSGLVDGLDVEQQKAQALVMADLITDDFTMEHGLFYINDDLWELQGQQALEGGRITALPDLDMARTFAILEAADLPKR